METLLKAGASVIDAKSLFGDAIEFSYLDLTKTLLRSGTDPNTPYHSWSHEYQDWYWRYGAVPPLFLASHEYSKVKEYETLTRL